MLSPSYLLHATEPAEEIAEKLHQDILQRIIERILRRIERGEGYILTAQDKWQLETIQEAGFLLDEVQKEITAAIPPMQTEIAQAMEDAGVVAMEYDDAIYQAAGLHPVGLTQSPHLIRILQRTFEATAGEWANVTRTTADAAQTAYIQACDRAYYLASSNAMTASQAVKEALNDIITEGVVVKYPSGHTDTLETATARAVRTGISQGAAQIQTARMDEMGVDLVIVSAHLGARPDHFKWQGKVYSRSGATDKYPDFVSSTSYGTVTGLCGANCRHSFSPYFEGQDNPYDQFDSKENQKAYEMQQRQRTMERRIRDTKRRLMGYEAAGDTERYQRTAALLQKQNAAYDAYCKENGLTKQTDRISIAKWNRSEAAKARVAAKKWKEYQTTRKYRKKSNQNGFFTMDNRAGSMDIIKPKNIINEMKKSYIGRTLYDFMQSNGIDVMLWYGVDAPSGRMGVFEDGIIHIYAENTKTILETALTVIHEATHAKINSPNSKNQEFECFKNEKIHQGIELTESVLQDIIKQIDELYPYLDWE